MPQVQLPIFPEGVVHLTAELAVRKEDGVVTYFNGQMPVFLHTESDVASFRMITAQFYVTGLCTEARIGQVFGVPTISVKRAVKRRGSRKKRLSPGRSDWPSLAINSPGAGLLPS